MPHPLSLRRLTRGFTIVELLVVIAVIGILVTIVIVSYNGAQTNARKSSLQATAQQVKLKLGEYYTDKNVYPLSKADVITYLNATDAKSAADAFGASYYGSAIDFTPCDTSSSACTVKNCDNVATPCRSYMITIPPAAWRGSASDASITIRP